ncbi:MAG: peptidylprolyl isomerase [Rudaea sp.]|uniref:peptidylprolyl isomerase n=1 Tax=Rudaea sp. TaxID=2136325 RepID=UPI0039E5A945
MKADTQQQDLSLTRAASLCALGLATMLAASLHAKPPVTAAKPVSAPTTAAVLAAAKPGDWRALDPQNTLYLELSGGRVVIELAPAFAPNHIANIKALAREKYYDGLAIVRAQDNYVVQMNDPDYENEAARKPIKTAKRSLPPEFTVAWDAKIPFTRLPDPDGYAPETGFSDGFAAARDMKAQRTWLTHCYGTVGVGRLNPVDSGGGPELYVVIGTPPRQLDRNVTVVGRVVKGIELLSTLPRGTGPYSLYEKPEQRAPIQRIRVAADVPENERVALEVLRTDTPTFEAYVESRRNHREEWYAVAAGHIDVCNVEVPVRAAPGAR